MMDRGKTPDDLAASMIPVACDLACLVRDGDLTGLAERLDSVADSGDGLQRFYALAVVMAAMIPDDRPVGDLLAWFEAGTPQRAQMLAKAHARAAKRQLRGLPLWGPLAALENEYQQGRLAAKRKAEAAGEGSAA